MIFAKMPDVSRGIKKSVFYRIYICRGSKSRGAPHPPSGKQYRDKDSLARNRTISEPVGEAGKPGHTTPDPGSSSRPRPMSMRYSPGILSPTSPVGSVSAGIILVHNFYPFLLCRHRFRIWIRSILT